MESQRSGRDAVTEFLLVLVPIGLAFATLGIPGFRVGPLVLKLHQLALLFALPFLLFLPSPGWGRQLRDSRSVILIAASLVLAILSSVFAKGLPVTELRDTKNIVLPMILMSVVLLKYMTSAVRVRRALAAIATGTLVSCVSVYARVGDALLGIRSIKVSELYETAGVSYVWLGVGGAATLGITCWFMFERRSVTSLSYLAAAVLALGSILVSGTRAAMVPIVLFPVAVVTVPRFPLRFWRLAVWSVVAVLLLVSLWPDPVIDYFNTRRYLTGMGQDSTDRFTASSAYKDDFGSRLWLWKLMQSNYTIREQLSGFDYQTALNRAGSVGHPHNIFVWARIMGGVPAAVLLALGVSGLICVPLRAMRDTGSDLRSLAFLAFFFHLLIVPSLVTNSWPGGNYLVFVVSVALTVFVGSQSCAPVPAPAQVRRENQEARAVIS